jgi:hypothetical protein
MSATVMLDLNGAPPSLTAVITNAVLEGGEPFALTVRSASGYQLTNGSYRFSGDFLQDIHPAGTQYGFDWTFSASTNGGLVWNGITGWGGGHMWLTTISNIALVPQAWLSISQAASTSVQINWAADFADHVLEYAVTLPAIGWSAVTNATTVAGERISITLEAGASARFYRLRKP